MSAEIQCPEGGDEDIEFQDIEELIWGMCCCGCDFVTDLKEIPK